MRALTVRPGVRDSAQLENVAEPPETEGTILVDGLAMGVCGTDIEIIAADYGTAPPGADFLILGHESLGRVADAPPATGLNAGDLVVGIVRRPDPVPCPNCAIGEWDMCRNGQYTERGIKELHGYGSERYRLQPEFAVKLDPELERVGMLLEPTTVVAKAWDHIERIGKRARWEPHVVLVTGAGPIGLLAALLGVQRGHEVHVLDQVTAGRKPDLVKQLGATYHSGPIDQLDVKADIVVECTGVPALVFDVMGRNAPDAVICLTGVSPTGRRISVDAGGLAREIVLQNDVVFGSVNANRRHYEQGAQALGKADRDWLEQLVTRRVPLTNFSEALTRGEDDVKVVIDLQA